MPFFDVCLVQIDGWCVISADRIHLIESAAAERNQIIGIDGQAVLMELMESNMEYMRIRYRLQFTVDLHLHLGRFVLDPSSDQCVIMTLISKSRIIISVHVIVAFGDFLVNILSEITRTSQFDDHRVTMHGKLAIIHELFRQADFIPTVRINIHIS